MIFFLFVYTSDASSHPPTKIATKVDGVAVDIVVTHPVSDPRAHYVKTIDVKVNGKTTVEQNYSLQAGDVQHAVYLIPSLREGDRVNIAAHCSQKGMLIQDITMGVLQPPSPGGPPSPEEETGTAEDSMQKDASGL